MWFETPLRCLDTFPFCSIFLFIFLLISLDISKLGSCCCFSAFSASCASCNSSSPLLSLSLEGHRTGWLAASSCIFSPLLPVVAVCEWLLPGVKGKRSQSCWETRKTQRPWKYGKGISRFCSFRGFCKHSFLLIGKTGVPTGIRDGVPQA